MNASADELLSNPDVPEHVKKVIRAEKMRKVQRRPAGFHIVGIARAGQEVEPGKRNYEDGTDRTYRERD